MKTIFKTGLLFAAAGIVVVFAVKFSCPDRSRTSTQPECAFIVNSTVVNHALKEAVRKDLLQAGQTVLSEGGQENAALKLRLAVTSRDHAGIDTARRELLEAGEKAVGSLTILLTCGEPKVEVEALRILIQTGNSRCLAMALGRMLNLDLSASGSAEYTAVFAECREGSVAHWLTRFIRDCSNSRIRKQAELLLAVLKGPETVMALGESAEKSRDTSYAYVVSVGLLGARHDPSEAQALIDLFDSTGIDEVKEAAAVALAGVGTAEVCHFLVDVSMRETPDARMALAAIPLISSIYAQESLLAAAQNTSLPQTTRVAAVTALSGQKSERVRIALANTYVRPSDSDLRKTINNAVTENSIQAGDAGTGGRDYEICF